MSTFYDKWNNGEQGYTNLGGFATKLMDCYRHADQGNREKLAAIYPSYFTELDMDIYNPVRAIMLELGITASYDTAKPQNWMDNMASMGWDRKDLYMNFVWLYDEQAKIFGRPFNYMAEYGRLILTKINL